MHVDSKELDRLSIDTEKNIEMLQMEKIRRRRKKDKDIISNNSENHIKIVSRDE